MIFIHNKVSIKLLLNDDGLTQIQLDTLQNCAFNGKQFWEDQMLYDVKFNTDLKESTITIDLNCKIWTAEKISALIQRPSDMTNYSKDNNKCEFLLQINIIGKIYTNLSPASQMHQLISHINEYLSSLIISQLEFRYPLVFSIVARNRFKMIEKCIGPLSYALTKSSHLFPTIIKCIAKDTTSTTVYQITIKPERSDKNKICKFGILKEL